MLKTYMILLIMSSETERNFCKLLIKKIVLINHGKIKINSQLFWGRGRGGGWGGIYSSSVMGKSYALHCI